MIYIFHGDNIDVSRKAFIEAIAKLKAGGIEEVVRLNGAEIVRSDLIQALESQSLFGGDRIVAIDGLFSRRVSKEKDLLISYILSSLVLLPSSFFLLLWEGKRILATGLKKFTGKPGVEMKEFKLPRLLYTFLDRIYPQNGKPASVIFNQLIEEEPVELVFYWMVKRITELILENSSAGQGSGYDDWKRQKLIEQASKWSGKGLVNFHKKLTEIDEAIKTGSTPSDLSSHLDILLVNL
jgi:DNA polymerase III delta subunit